MEHKRKIYNELKDILQNLLTAINRFDVKSFDYDDDFKTLLSKNKIDFDYGIIKQVYFVVDITYDAINHSFKEVNADYNYNDVRRDLIYIISCIEKNDIVSGLEQNEEFLSRLEKAIAEQSKE